jgi:hypothetical protein
MRHRAARAIPALASVLAVGIAVGGCSSATAGASSAGSTSSATASAAARTSAPFYGPPGPDPACVAARKAEQTLQARQGKDQKNESAIDQDFTNFANALSAAAQQEKHPATAKAMTNLANDYTALVESQSGAEQLPDMSTIQNDGAAFDKACSLFLTPYAGVLMDPGVRFPAPLSGPVVGPESRFSCQVQAVPLIANDVGLATLLLQLPWKPSVVLAPGATVPL